MNRNLNLALSLAAGLLGGFLVHFVAPLTVNAQAQTSAPKEMRAQRFVLVNERGVVYGMFSLDPGAGVIPPNETPVIKLSDGRGTELWRTPIALARPIK
jgi:hypothetical protein